MSDLEARVVRLEQLLAQLLRDLRKAEDEAGTVSQAVGLIRNAPGS